MPTDPVNRVKPSLPTAIQGADHTQQVEANEALPTRTTAIDRPGDMSRIAGAKTAGVELPAQVSNARRVDLAELAEKVGKGTFESRIHLSPGQKIAGAKIPEGLYVVMELAVKDNGELNHEACRMRFENAEGRAVALDREHSIFDVLGASMSEDGEVKVDIAWSPFDVDVTKALLGRAKLPAELNDVIALTMEKSAKGGEARVIDTKDVSYSGFFVAKPGSWKLAGESSIELHEKANVFIKGNADMGMAQINTPAKGATLNLVSADGAALASGPSTLNARVGYLRGSNERFLMFHDTVLNDVKLQAKLGETPVSFNIGKVNLDGHDEPSAVTDQRFAGMEAKAKELGTNVPPSEVAGSDIEGVVVRKFIESWPLDSIAEWHPDKIARLLQSPDKDDVPGLIGLLFGGMVVDGVEAGLERVPYFIRDRLAAMPEAELAIVVQRALLAELATRWSTAISRNVEEEPESRNAHGTKQNYEERYQREARQLGKMYTELLGQTTDEAKRASINEKLAALQAPGCSANEPRNIALDYAILSAADESLRPDPEIPPYDAFALKFERDGSLDENVQNVIVPKLLQIAADRGIDVSRARDIQLDNVSLKPGIQPLAFMALSHPMVRQAMADPRVRRVAAQAGESVKKLAAGFALMRARDIPAAMLERAMTPELAGALGMSHEQALTTVRGLAGMPESQRNEVLARLDAAGNQIFEMGKAELREQFVGLGGMQPNGRAEAFMNLVIDEVIKADFLPEAAVNKLKSERDKFIGMALNTARAAVWIRLQPNYEDWPVLGANLIAKVAQEDAERTKLGSDAWMRELTKLTGADFSGKNAIENLKDGPAFFGRVKQLIEDTPKPGPVYVNYWAMYDDTSGTEMRDILVAKKQAGYDISVVVDGKTNQSTGLGKKDVIPALQAAGIPVVLWNNPEQPPVGNHIKYIATPAGVVTGGSNIGDEYTHSGHPHTKWTDTNVAIIGDATKHFLAKHEAILREAGVEPPAHGPLKVTAAPAGSDAKVALVHDVPADNAHPILAATLKMLEGAQTGETVRIKNAYFVMTEPVRLGLERALERGVNIEVFTNSPMSVDEPVVAKPILESAREALRLGERIGKGDVKVYMPKINLENPQESDRNTVHDKVTLAGNVSAVMTYNLHPRSETLEHEIATVVVDADTAAAQKARWDAKVAVGTEITSSDHPLFAAFPVKAEDLALEVFKNIF